MAKVILHHIAGTFYFQSCCFTRTFVKVMINSISILQPGMQNKIKFCQLVARVAMRKVELFLTLSSNTRPIRNNHCYNSSVAKSASGRAIERQTNPKKLCMPRIQKKEKAYRICYYIYRYLKVEKIPPFSVQN